jgi:hypothetical protein
MPDQRACRASHPSARRTVRAAPPLLGTMPTRSGRFGASEQRMTARASRRGPKFDPFLPRRRRGVCCRDFVAMLRPLIASLALVILPLPGSMPWDRPCVARGEHVSAEAAPVCESPDLVAVAATAEADPSRTPTPVPWCRSADDPRCQPDEGGGVIDVRPPTTLVAVLPGSPGLPRVGAVRVRFVGGASEGPSGLRARIERPPRT